VLSFVGVSVIFSVFRRFSTPTVEFDMVIFSDVFQVGPAIVEAVGVIVMTEQSGRSAIDKTVHKYQFSLSAEPDPSAGVNF